MSLKQHRRWHDLYRTDHTTIDDPSTTTLGMFRATLSRGRDAPLVHYFDRTISAGALDEMSDALAVEFQAHGVDAGDRIGMYLQNIPQVMITVLAAWKCGAVIVPCNPMLRERELAKILRASGSRLLVCQEDLYADVAQVAIPDTAVERTFTTSPLEFLPEDEPLPPILSGMARRPTVSASDLMQVIERNRGKQPVAVEVSPSDIAFMVYTSGTTGEPKGAMNTHSNVVFATSVYQHWIDLSEADTILGLAPLFHVTGLIGHVTLTMLTGAPLVLFYRFDPNEACRLVERHRATFTVSAVTAFIALLNSDAMQQRDISSLTKIYTGGAPTPPTVLEDWHGRTGVRIHPMYGLTEATSPTHMTPHGEIPPIDHHTGAMSVGVPVFNTDVKVMTDTGLVAEPGEIGEFVIQGPQIVPGYWQKPNETARTITPEGLRTGDVGFMDDKGWFYLVDRSKDMIVASGFKVWPREVEEVLYQHPAVREAAVVGVPDPYRGETIKAVVSLKQGQSATPEEIRAFAREQLAAYKYPRIVEIIDELPKTTSGKIMRRLLQPTTRATLPMEVAESELATVSYPQLRAAVEARAVLEAGAIWLRLSRGPISRSVAESLYAKLHDMLSQLRDDGHFVDRDAFLAANKAYHAAVIAIADNEHLSVGFELLKLRQLYRSALKDTTVAAENVVHFHEFLTDAIAAGDTTGAMQAVQSWSKSAASRAMRALGAYSGQPDDGDDLRLSGVVEDLSVAAAKEQVDLATDVDALVQAIDARAALEIGITQSLGNTLSIEAERNALVARLRAFTPLVRGSSPAHVARYIRADDAFHRVFLSLLRNPRLFEIYNSMDIPELMRRVLEVAPVSIREVFDDHKGLTNALRTGSAEKTCAAITEHANRVRASLAAFLAETQALAAESAAESGAAAAPGAS
jgi:long-chain acyl-CoA synthetase